jgi:hypothetical protein
VLEPVSLIYINTRDLIQLVKSKIKQNGKYQNIGLSMAAIIEIFKFVFVGAWYFIKVERVLYKYINIVMTAL